MTVNPKPLGTRNDLGGETRSKVSKLLNQHLADLIDLHTQVKVAHWNVKGPNFIAIHKLFDEFAETLEAAIDDVGERITAIGYVALGTARQVAEKSNVSEFPLDSLAAKDVVEALADRYAALGKTIRANIDVAMELGDAGTADLLTGISRDMDQALYFLEATLH